MGKQPVRVELAISWFEMEGGPVCQKTLICLTCPASAPNHQTPLQYAYGLYIACSAGYVCCIYEKMYDRSFSPDEGLTGSFLEKQISS